ncbi:hypothetical protein F5050DRAFT_1726080 [Lentinula boryana]|uniref:No apical meristem-associated C-terminal domain-containing protein n=1 Tax=Lentinula boryana TaxID=40481 RepID=A0ABQ8QS58_9AGAR|nr:hypothetical protein F5050DRAFT_1726080 [Lentinula boryana]
MSGALPSSETPSNLNGGFDALFSAIEQVEAQDQGVNTVPQASLRGRFRIPSRPTTPPLVTYNKRPASESPQKPPPKRVGGRGRGRGRGRGAKSSGTAIPSKTSTAGMKAFKVDVPADPPNDDIFTSGRWSAAEQTALFTHIFGSESDDIHAKWLKNKDRVYKKYLEANLSVAKRFTVSSVASKITAAITMYSYIREYEEFTGGGGDADLQSMVPESDEWHKQRLILAKRGGKSIGSLTVKKYHEWKDNGWYDIFEERFGRSSKVDRHIVRDSVAPISPILKDDDDIDNIHWPPTPGRKSPTQSIHSDSEGETLIVLKTPKAGASCSTPASQAVSEPHYQAPATMKSSAKKKNSLASADAFGAINTFFESKAKLTQEQLRRSMTESANSAQSQQLQELRNILDSNIDELTREVVNEKIRKLISDYY